MESGGDVVHASEEPNFEEDRRLVEDFAQVVATVFRQRFLVVVLLPWHSGSPAEDILAPNAQTGLLDAAHLEHAVQGKAGVIACCTFKHAEEEAATPRLISQLRGAQSNMCIFALHLHADNAQYTEGNWEELMRKHQCILDSGVDDVLLDPDKEPSQLTLAVNVAYDTWEASQQRLEMLMTSEPDQAEVDELERRHHELLWEEIPRELMPHFRRLQGDLVETADTVGPYRFVARLKSRSSVLWEARREEDNMQVVVKVIDKALILLPNEVEGINRDYRFLKSFMSHPNIVKMLDMLHSRKYIYTILEYAGPQSLSQHLAESTDLRMDKDVALFVFWQIVSALAHCHSKEICHRGLAPEHVVLSTREDGSLLAKLIDFRTALLSKTDATFRAMCGRLPYMAPEMLNGGPYIPALVDSWSAGVILLEMTGGVGCFLNAHQMDAAMAENLFNAEIEERTQAAEDILSWASTSEGVQEALSWKGSAPQQDVTDILATVLVSEPMRMTVIEMERCHLERN